jgi:protein-L-isoaspartate(D-aspartate) O-methyltransferase
MLRDGIALETDNPDLRPDAAALDAALHAPRLERWSGAAWDLPDELELFLTLNLARTARLYASQDVIDQGIVGPGARMGATVLIDGGSLAYRTRRENEAVGGFESGVIAHGPHAGTLAGQYVDLLRRWARDHRRRGAATFRYLPHGTAPDPLPQGAVIKRHGVVTVSWH